MSRRRLDVVVAGGGVVGAACALALARCDLSVALIEGVEPPRWDAAHPDLRVYAFADDNAALLDDLGVWAQVRDARVQPYRYMRVWDAADTGELVFDADALGRRELGWIVEHALLVDRLWAALPAAGVQVHCPARTVALEQDAAGVRVQLDDDRRLDARLLVAADGAGSSVRSLAGLQVAAHDYAQRGVVAYVETALPHADTAWQRFLPGGPLAVLPCTDGRASIVWTLPEARATQALALDDAPFNAALTRALDARLGPMRVVSPRAAFPLRRQLASSHAAGRVLLVGDAAHVVHPLAGQGVNLGLRDVSGLRGMVVEAQRAGRDWDAPHRIARWARTRRSENAIAARAFEAINAAFSTDAPVPTLLRGPLLRAAGHAPGVAGLLWRHAAGL